MRALLQKELEPPEGGFNEATNEEAVRVAPCTTSERPLLEFSNDNQSKHKEQAACSSLKPNSKKRWRTTTPRQKSDFEEISAELLVYETFAQPLSNVVRIASCHFKNDF